MNIIKQIEKEVKEKINEYKDNAEDHYDFWNEHIKYVYIESQKLARQYSADIEIVKLGALLHDIALICKVGERKDHHINGKILAEEILKKYDYPKEKMDRVLSCVYNHRRVKMQEVLKIYALRMLILLLILIIYQCYLILHIIETILILMK